MPRTPDPLVDFATTHHGLIGRAQALEMGVSPGLVDARVRAGRLVVVHRGVYRVAGAPVTWTSRVLAACLATGGVASHRSAASLLDVRGVPNGRPEVTTARRDQSTIPNLRLHRSRDLHKANVIERHGIPTTDPARLAVDLGAVWPEQRVEGAIQDLVTRRLLSWDDVGVAVLRHSKRGRDGVGVARRIVDRRMQGLVGDSILESVLLALLHDGGLPAPELQVEIAVDGSFVARVDVAWPDRGVVVEADSVKWHLNEASFEADKAKRNRLRLAGWLVHEVTWEMCMDHGARIVSEIRAALDGRPPGSFRSFTPHPPPILGELHVLGDGQSHPERGRG